MGDLYDLNKRFNHRWKTDPLFLKDFDYDNPKYAHVPDDLKWMLPMHEQQQTDLVRQAHAEVNARVTVKIENERRQERLKAFKKLSET